MTYKVQEIFKWFNQFDKENIKIKGENKEFDVEIKNIALPHLLGLQYIENEKKIKGRELYNFIKQNNLSDEDILKKVKENNYYKVVEVEKRIDTFQYFLENIEDGYIFEKTNINTDIKSNYLIIQTKDNLILHLGLKQDEVEDRIDNFAVFEKDTYFETYFARNDNKYYKGSQTMEKVTALYRYNEKYGMYEDFSFKNHNLENSINNIFEQVYKTKDKELER